MHSRVAKTHRSAGPMTPTTRVFSTVIAAFVAVFGHLDAVKAALTPRAGPNAAADLVVSDNTVITWPVPPEELASAGQKWSWTAAQNNDAVGRCDADDLVASERA